MHLLNAQSYEILKTLRKNIFLLTSEGSPSKKLGVGNAFREDKISQENSTWPLSPSFSRLQKSCLPWQPHEECNIHFESIRMRNNSRLKALSQVGGYSVQIIGNQLAMTASLSPHNPSLGNYRHVPQEVHQHPCKALLPLLKTSPIELVRGKHPQRWVCYLPSARLCLPGQKVKRAAREGPESTGTARPFCGGLD